MDDEERQDEKYYFQDQQPTKAMVVVTLALLPVLLLGVSAKTFYDRVEWGVTKWRFKMAHGRPMLPAEELILRISRIDFTKK